MQFYQIWLFQMLDLLKIGHSIFEKKNDMPALPIDMTLSFTFNDSEIRKNLANLTNNRNKN